MVAFEVAYLFDDHATVHASIDGNLVQWAFESLGNDASTGSDVTIFDRLSELVDHGLGTKQRDAATSDNTLFNSSLGSRHSIFDAVLLFLEFDLSSGADLEDSNAAAQLSETLLELLTVVIAVGVLDLGLDLSDPACDVGLLASAFDNDGLVLGDDNLASLAEHFKPNVLELEADFFANNLATGKDCQVLQHCLAAVAKARSLDSDRGEGATDLVHNECCKRFTLDIFSDDHKWLATLHDLFKDRNNVSYGTDLGTNQQQVRVIHDRFHTLGVRHHVWR